FFHIFDLKYLIELSYFMNQYTILVRYKKVPFMKEKLFDYKNFIHLFQGFLLVIYLIDQTLLQKTTEFYLVLLGILLLVEASKVRFNHMMVTKGVAIMGIVLIAYKTRAAGVKAFAF